MNKMLISVLCALASLTANADISHQTNLLDVSILQNLPAIKVESVEVNRPHPLTPVQPTAFLKFKFASCASQRLEAHTQEEGRILLVAIQHLPNQMDCMGPSITRTYSLQITSDYSGQRVVVLNPIKQGLF
jgi:hypothetical protein